ncbi:transcriptional regulator [Verrucomicrobiaceae bacterium N1E253]|uniref:HTH-type transcriptional regulator n=1 Tax=Oceaniferula marina TaxID=2748318 RepID=A0A851GB07_9BACT|nr:transcriptional regulator [Oceaniferula marina]NWK54359.1 transcriptional regulator [Oceaniferula marina]
MNASTDSEARCFDEIRDDFISQWGAFGSQWGINRTMAQIHALLMIMPEALSTDEVMEYLTISRGNAHTNLKELVNWGLVRILVRRGERKEFFEAEKDVWKIFTIILRERQRREIDPALELLRGCHEETKDLEGVGAEAFRNQIRELETFVSFARNVGGKIDKLHYGPAMKLAAKLLS